MGEGPHRGAPEKRVSDAAVDRLNGALSGRYRIEEEIGEGGMAKVYLAHDERHGRRVAVKVLHPELSAALGAERFLEEIRVTATLQHPHIVPLFDSGSVEASLFYVMPYVVGETLRAKLARERQLGVEESVEIARSIAAALHHAHGHDVVHRDLKPDNVMLCDGLPLVLDFGVAGAVENAGAEGPSRPGATLGTPGYMSPEQASGTHVDARSDVYALGCLLYEMVTGQPPYSGRTTRAVLARVLMDPVPSPRRSRPALPGEIDSVIRRALAKDPADRFSTAAEMGAALGGRSARRDEITPSVSVRSDTLAVLPLRNLGDDKEDAYVAEGVTDDIIMSLSRISGLRVISRSSVMAYGDVGRDVTRIATDLGVGTVVDGSVRRSGTRMRIVVHLVDAASGAHIWSDTYDRGLEDVFEVQSEVAASVARAVRLELSRANREGIEVRGTRDADAYDMYLRGRFHWNQRRDASVGESLAHFGRALERDPDFALAHAALADAHAILGIYGGEPTPEAMGAARRAALRALELDPTLGEAWASLACVHAMHDWDWLEAEECFRRSIEAAPSYATAHQWLAMNLLTPCRRFAEAVARLDRAEELDPRSGAVAVSRGIVAFYERDLAYAAQALDAAARAHPRFGLAHYFLGQCLEAMGHGDKAVEPLRHAVMLSDERSETLAALGHSLGSQGQTEEAEGVARRLANRARRGYVSPALRAQVQLGLKKGGAALDLLEEAAEVRAAELVWLGVQPAYDPLREEPRFQALLERVGLPA